jgi:agmatine deiminase
MNRARRRWLLGAAACALRPATVRAGDPFAPPSIAADFDPVSTVWLGAAPGHEALTRGLIEALQGQVRLRCLVPDDEHAAYARLLWPALEVEIEPGIGFFLRDHAVLTREADGTTGVVDLRASQYGAAAWCAKRHAAGPEREDCVAHAQGAAAAQDGFDRALAHRIGARLHATPLALEGGGIEVNGRGLMIANASLHASRNPGWSRHALEAALRRLPGVDKVIWLPAGLAEDPLLRATIVGDHVAWGTGGHTDQFVRFADPHTVLLAWPDPQDPHPVIRMSAARMQRNRAILEAATDARGRRLRVLALPMPRLVQRRVLLDGVPSSGTEEGHEWRADHFAAHDHRRAGQAVWQVASASSLNFVVANGVVVAPDYRPHGTPAALHERTERVLADAFAGRRIVHVEAISANWVGGGLHCATLNQP